MVQCRRHGEPRRDAAVSPEHGCGPMQDPAGFRAATELPDSRFPPKLNQCPKKPWQAQVRLVRTQFMYICTGRGLSRKPDYDIMPRASFVRGAPARTAIRPICLRTQALRGRSQQGS
jgi:hypothetical protein